MLKKYIQFIKESSVDTSKYTELKEEVKSMIEKTIENSGGEFKSFMDSLIQNPEDVKIEGLINDSDLYEFYLKYRNDIDELLNDIKFFGNSPSDINSIGLYDYLIKGTQKSIEEIVKILSDDGSGS